MGDDIVTRLRYYGKHLIPNADFFTVQGELVAAADEIERLRTDRLQWREIARSLAMQGSCVHSLDWGKCPGMDCDWNRAMTTYEIASERE